jgi:hypothetical protein
MEQPCYKCGQSVEEGIAFCPHCSAPQIRVIVAEAALSPASAGGMAASVAAVETVPGIAVPMSWSRSVRPCALAGLIAAVTMVLQLVVPLIAVIGAGFLAVAFYRRSAPAAAMNAKTGALLGALCGFFCAGLTAILESLKIIALHQAGDVRHWMVEIIQQAATRYPDPDAQPMLDFMRSPAGLIFMMVFFLITAFLLCIVLGTLGGSLGGVAFTRRDKN